MKDRVQKRMQPLLKQYETYKPLQLSTTQIGHYHVPDLLAGSVGMSQNSGQSLGSSV